MKQRRFHVLRLISVFYKSLALVLVLASIGAVGYLGIQAVQSPMADYFDFQVWIAQSAGIVIGGGLIALTLYVLAQLIDTQIAIHDRLNEIARSFSRNPPRPRPPETPPISP